MRSIISAQEKYATANGGYYESKLECLSMPFEGCIPGYPEEAPPFSLDDFQSEQVKIGYIRIFHPGASPNLTPEQAARVSPTSIESYAYVAVPENQNVTGIRAFCGDSTGMICVFHDGNVPPIQDGRCPFDCEPQQ
jgi:hypothetical protein